MNTFEKAFIKNINPVFFVEQAQGGTEIDKADMFQQQNVSRIVGLMDAAVQSKNFGNSNVYVLSEIYKDPELARINEINAKIGSYIEKAKAMLGSGLQDLVKDVGGLKTEQVLDLMSTSKPEEPVVPETTPEKDSEQTKEISAQASKQSEQASKITDDIINNPDVKSLVTICKNYSDTTKINNGVDALMLILAQTEKNTYNLSSQELNIIKAYKARLEQFENQEKDSIDAQVSNIFSSMQSAFDNADMSSSQPIKKESYTFKKHLKHPEQINEGILTDMFTWLFRKGRKAYSFVSRYLSNVSTVFKFVFFGVVMLYLPKLVGFLLNNAGEIVSKLLFPLAAFTSASRIIVVGGEGIDPSETVDKAVQKIVGGIVSPIKGIFDAFKSSKIGSFLTFGFTKFIK